MKCQPVYLFSRGIIPDPAVDVAFGQRYFNTRSYKITPTAAGNSTLNIRAVQPGGSTKWNATTTLRVADTPVNPSAARNIICMGDSITAGQDAVGSDYPNELSRRLRGIGDALDTGTASPTALALSNMLFRGTRGGYTVKHEGRPGWSADRYLTDDDPVTNAFWDPVAGEFSMEHYLFDNGFDLTGDPTNGVDATGSNLTVVLCLGWNDVWNTTVSASAARLGDLVDAIHATHPDTEIVIFGLWPAPELNVKNFSATRYVSPVQIFELVVRDYGVAYKAMAENRTNVEFLQVSHVFDPETGYNTDVFEVSARSAATYTAATDHVHPSNIGYAYIADAVFARLIHLYCQ